MRQLQWLVCLGAAAAVLAASSGYTQDTKKEGDPTFKGTLPQGWSKIGLSADQKKKITTIRGTYAGKIDNLKKQIDQLKEEDMAECLKVLTDDQKNQLKKIVADKIDGTKDKDKDKDKNNREDEGDNPKNDRTAQRAQPAAVAPRRQDD